MKRKGVAALLLAVVLLTAVGWRLLDRLAILPQRCYTAAELGITEAYSKKDANHNGIDDFHDLVNGARAYVESKPVYKSVYYAGGYPDDEHGVCTDVIGQAFAAAGYSLKDMVDADIQQDPQAYGIEYADPNIDFRRVRNLRVFFERHAQTIHGEQPADYQPGDIIVYSEHIALCSDRRNKEGYPFILHFDGWGARERNELFSNTIIGHYRWT